MPVTGGIWAATLPMTAGYNLVSKFSESTKLSFTNNPLPTIFSTSSVTNTNRQLNLTSNSAGLIPFNSYGAVLVSAEHTEVNRISRVPLTS